jgi:hypothetical protein
MQQPERSWQATSSLYYSRPERKDLQRPCRHSYGSDGGLATGKSEGRARVDPSDGPRECRPYVQGWQATLQRGHPSGALILKPRKFASKPSCDRTANGTAA